MLIWYGAGLFVSLLVAWLAAVLQASVRIPVGIIPIGIGILLAVSLTSLAMLTNVRQDRSFILGSLVLAAITVLAQHAWLYIDYRRQWHEALAKAPSFSGFPAKVPTPIEYFSQELTFARGVLWCIDGALIIGFTIGTIWVLERKRRGLEKPSQRENPNPKP